jgi:adenine-specific DNA-methyltransferase
MLVENADEPYAEIIAEAITSAKRNGIYIDTTSKLKKIISNALQFIPIDSRKNDIKKLFLDEKLFPYPKSVKYIKTLIKTCDYKDGIIMDFFSGSATTAHAVMELNARDGGKRKYIMVQLPEETDEKAEAYKAGYSNICEIGKERIRRAGTKIKEEAGLMAQDLDVGFRVLKLDSSNMKDVYYNPSEITESLIELAADNIKEDRTPEDLLFQVMLELGVLLSSKIEEKVNCKMRVPFVREESRFESESPVL